MAELRHHVPESNVDQQINTSHHLSCHVGPRPSHAMAHSGACVNVTATPRRGRRGRRALGGSAEILFVIYGVVLGVRAGGRRCETGSLYAGV